MVLLLHENVWLNVPVGPGGYVAAIKAAQHGLKVCCEDFLVGGCSQI